MLLIPEVPVEHDGVTSFPDSRLVDGLEKQVAGAELVGGTRLAVGVSRYKGSDWTPPQAKAMKMADVAEHQALSNTLPGLSAALLHPPFQTLASSIPSQKPST